MEKVKSLDEFKELKKRLAAGRDPDMPTIVIPAGTCGQASGANDLIRIVKRELLARQLTEKMNLRITGCHGLCEMEPSVRIEPYGTFYPKVDLDGIVRIIEAACKGEVVEDLLFIDPKTGKPVEKQEDLPFFMRQVRTILARNEKVDPIRIYNYIENGGYSALAQIFENGSPDWVIGEVKASGLRGRGGAGFPTGLKWEVLAKQSSDRGKFLVCNADEGDPGAYMDRSVLEGNPHSIIEGMIIGAYATSSTEGIVYVRHEYPLAVKHLVIALRQARELGLLGENILGTGFSFDIRLVKGAGAFVCGEETSLIASIEGRMGEPRQRPPFPVQKGIYGKPTAINNVETWANIPVIFEKGAAEFVKTGTKNNFGTKIFSLVGKVMYTGLAEVPMGTTIHEIVFDIGGGPTGRSKIKAIQTGGPSGGCIPTEMFGLSIDYETLKEAGSTMGSGGMIVMDENTCMVDVARYFMNFLKDESCGKCFTCRKGTQRMYEILDDITKGHGTLEQLELLEELAHVVMDTTMCALGQTAPNPVLSTLRYFRSEYEHHIVQKRCDAFVCKELVGAPCQAACPLGTEAWRYIAHIKRGEYKDAYRVIREANPFPSVCARVCNHPCEERCRAGVSGSQPISIRSLKRFITDRVNPALYKPARNINPDKEMPKVAVVGSGPAGLSAAHYLSLDGYKVTVFEAEAQPGGMLRSGIPAYRLPKEVLNNEIESLVNENLIIKCNAGLGDDVTIEKLFDDGFRAVFLAMGAHESQGLDIEGENAEGVYTGMDFLKAFNLDGQELAKGRVGVIGGGNSAIDAARVAIRQKDVESVSLYYRRSRQEMPAFAEEIEAALQEGIQIETLVSPLKIHSRGGHLTGIECIRNELGEMDVSGRREPIPLPNTEHSLSLDTLIVAIGEQPKTGDVSSMGIEIGKGKRVLVNAETLLTNHDGVFAGGDVISGSRTVVEAIAAGKRAAMMIDRYLKGEKLRRVYQSQLPKVYIEPAVTDGKDMAQVPRAKQPIIPVESRKQSFAEVEGALSVQEAEQEAGRCLRCDLEFTQPKEGTIESLIAEGERA